MRYASPDEIYAQGFRDGKKAAVDFLRQLAAKKLEETATWGHYPSIVEAKSVAKMLRRCADRVQALRKSKPRKPLFFSPKKGT